MASLVADYSGSESENEDSCDNLSPKTESEIKQEPGSPSANSVPHANFFESSNNNNSSDEEADEKKDNHKNSHKFQVKTESDNREKLPNPLTAGAGKLPSILEATTSRIGTSVFVNPFEEAEQAKNQILEKHVKLTQAAPKKPAHQPVCWKFKKGKCHMGKNCRFFHDLENRTLEENNETNVSQPTNESSQRQLYHPAAYHDARRRPMEQEPIDDDNYMASMKKKKRFGMSDGLMPPKKAFESLQRQRERERPWTLTQK